MYGGAVDAPSFLGVVVGSTPRGDVFRLQQDIKRNWGARFSVGRCRLRATCLRKNHFSPLISRVLKLILVVRCSGGGSEETDKTHY